MEPARPKSIGPIATSLGKLAVYELGEGPPTLLWPSLYVDHQSLVPLAAELARSRRCILLDGPGHGQSAVPDRRYTLWDCARATEEVLDALAIPTVDWIGNAWGGHVGLCVAITSPARVRTLTVIGSPMEALSRSMRVQSRLGLGLMKLGARDFVGKLVAKAMISPASPVEHHEVVRRCIRESPGIALAIHSISLGRPDLRPELSRVTVPTLFIAGGDDPMWKPDVAARDAALLPDGRFVTVPAAAHLVPLERPTETAAAITSFLA
ncbi:MAG TPA: alpha/beta hydrolase [Kofleriaceae bacterium]